MVFQPLEETSRLYFSSLAAAAASSPGPTDASQRAENTKAPKTEPAAAKGTGDDMAAPPALAALVPCASYLRLVLLLQTHLALIFVFLAPSFTTPLLHLLLGSKWSRTSAVPILRAYAYSLPFMGLNGITEAFFQAVANPRWIQRGAVWMVVCAAAFATTCWVAVRVGGMGARGLIVANCVNMALRTAFSSHFMLRYFSTALRSHPAASRSTTAEAGMKSSTTAASEEDQQAVAIRRALNWRQWTPSLLTGSTFLLSASACRRSEAQWAVRVMGTPGGGGRVLSKKEEVWETARHLSVGAGVGLLCLVSV